MNRLGPFLREVYAPGLHLVFALAWFVALGLAWLAGQPALEAGWRAYAAWPVGVLVLFVMLFYLRVADELKDEAYDRVFNPDRPLVRGTVERQDLRVYLMVSALLALNLTLPLSVAAVGWLVADLVWALALMGLERVSRIVRDHILVNLLVTYPVNVLLSLYALQLLGDAYGLAWDSRALGLVVGFACAFLHFEFARKTVWPAAAKPDERLYTQVLGGVGGGVLMLAWAVAGVVVVVVVLAPWRGGAAWAGLLPLLSLWPVLGTARRYFAAGGARVALKGGGMRFLVWFYASVALAAAIQLLGS